MAINNWRSTYVRQYTPEQLYQLWQEVAGEQTASTASPVTTWAYVNSQSFSPSDVYSMQAQWYYDQGNTNLWDAYSALWSWSNAFSNTANQINNFYNALAQDVANREAWLAWAKYNLANQLNQDLLSQRQYVMDMFWPNWTLTNEVNKYYDDLSNYLATDAGRQAANIAAQWLHSWASLWAIRAQQNEAYNESFGRYVQAKEQEINAKQQIASNLINYMSTLRQEYWDTTNTYIIQQYQRANDLLNTISQSIANSNIELASAKLSNSLWGSRSSSSSSSVILPPSAINKIYSQLSAEDKATFDTLPSSQQQQVLANLYYQWLANSVSNSSDEEDITDVVLH